MREFEREKTLVRMETVQDLIEREGIFATWCRLSSWHGIGDFYRSQHKLTKAIWLLLILLSLSQIVQQIASFIQDFCSGEIWRTDTYVTNAENGLPFPNVTICAHRPIDESRVEELNFSQNALMYVVQSASILNDLRYPFNKTWFLEREPEFIAFAREHLFARDLVQIANVVLFKCDAVLLYCALETSKFNCCDYARRVIGSDQTCLSLTPGVQKDGLPLSQRIPGPGFGVTLLLDANTRFAQSYGLQTGHQLHLNFAPNDEFQVPNPVAVAPKTTSYISMRYQMSKVNLPNQIYKYLYSPPLPCLHHSENRTFKHLEGMYSTSACYEDCRHSGYIKLCNCTKPANLRAGFSICKPQQAVECREKLDEQQRLNYLRRQEVLDEEVKECFKTCTHPCEERSITASISTSPVSGRNMGQIYQYLTGLNMSEEQLEDVMLVNIYYDTSSYQVNALTERVTLDGLISSIGGVMGLWAGLSVITLAQLAVYFTYGVLAALYRLCNGETTKMTIGS